MAALTADRDTYEVEDLRTQLPLDVAAATTIYAGGAVSKDASGNAVPAADGTGPVYGVAVKFVDNSAGAAGDEVVETHAGIFHFTNSGTDALDKTDILNLCYLEDDQTVAATQNATGTLPVAGIFLGLDADKGARVLVGATTAAAATSADLISVEATIPDISTADEVYAASPVNGRVVAVLSCIDAAITVADAVLTPKINTVDMTGGGITVANAGSAPGDVDFSEPTAANVVAFGDTLSVETDGGSTTTSLCRVTFLIEKA